MARMKKCVAVFVLALGAAQGKRALLQVPEAIAQATTMAGETASRAGDSITQATQSFAGTLKQGDKTVSSQIDQAAAAVKATVPKEFNTSPGKLFNAAADSLLPADFQKQVQLAIKNFANVDAKTVDPQLRDYAKMMAGIFLLDNSGDSNFANTRFGDLIKQLIDFTFNSLKVYATAPIKVVTELPQDLAMAISHSTPVNFAAWFLDHKQMYEDLLGLVYKPERDENGTITGSTVGTISHPGSVALSNNFINYAPCIISSAPTGLAYGSSFINIVPSLVQSAPTGFNVQPQIANIQPALIYVFPAGLNIQPQGLNVAPTLIGVTPGGYTNVPAGGVVGGALLAVTVAQPPSR